MEKMKGYFACPLASGEDRKTALALVELIEKLGHKILDRHVVAGYEKSREEFCKNSGLSLDDYNPVNVRNQDLKWVMESSFMVLDYTNGSWGGGIDLCHASTVRHLRGLEPIPILCLRRKNTRASLLVLGISEEEFPLVFHAEYESLEEAEEHIRNFFLLIPRLYE